MGLRVEPGDLADKTSVFQQRAQRERARVKVLISVVEAVIAGSYAGKVSPVAAAQRVLGEAETPQVTDAAAEASGALAVGTKDVLAAALEDLRWDEEGLASQAGALAPGLFESIYLAAISSPVADAVIVAGVAADAALGLDVPEPQNGRDKLNVEKGQALGSWGLGIAIVALGIVGAVAAFWIAGRKP